MTEKNYPTPAEIQYFSEFCVDFEEFNHRLRSLLASLPLKEEHFLAYTNALLDFVTTHTLLSISHKHLLALEAHSILNVIPELLFPRRYLDEYWDEEAHSIKDGYDLIYGELVDGWVMVKEVCFGEIVRTIGRMRTEIARIDEYDAVEEKKKKRPKPKQVGQLSGKEFDILSVLVEPTNQRKRMTVKDIRKVLDLQSEKDIYDLTDHGVWRVVDDLRSKGFVTKEEEKDGFFATKEGIKLMVSGQ